MFYNMFLKKLWLLQYKKMATLREQPSSLRYTQQLNTEYVIPTPTYGWKPFGP